MKYLGYILITIGIILATFVLYTYIQTKAAPVSPVPEGEGVRVIFSKPSK